MITKARTRQNFINGEWVDAESGAIVASSEPRSDGGAAG